MKTYELGIERFLGDKFVSASDGNICEPPTILDERCLVVRCWFDNNGSDHYSLCLMGSNEVISFLKGKEVIIACNGGVGYADCEPLDIVGWCYEHTLTDMSKVETNNQKG